MPESEVKRMLHVEIDLKDGTSFKFNGELAEKASNVMQDEDLIRFGDVVIITKDNLKSYYCYIEEVKS